MALAEPVANGIYKTTDGGKTWDQILKVSDNTGFNEVHIDPQHPAILYACAHQRRRHEWSYISGGPESAVYKSTDRGRNTDQTATDFLRRYWEDWTGHFASEQRCGFTPLWRRATKKAFYRSTDRGASWTKQSSYATDGNYYQEIIADPKTWTACIRWLRAQVSNDGGKTFRTLAKKSKHVDNHCIWIDPQHPRHYLMGCDGGLYESFDGAENWDFKANLPITQFTECVWTTANHFITYMAEHRTTTPLAGQPNYQCKRNNQCGLVCNSGRRWFSEQG